QFELLLAPFAENIVASDISPQAIAAANARAAQQGVKNVTFRCAAPAETEVGERFDTVICLAFLHHVPVDEVVPLLRRCHAQLNDGGCFYSQDPNRGGILRLLGRAIARRRYDRYHSSDERELVP